jgi:Icc-related predicted phosphoesterase
MFYVPGNHDYYVNDPICCDALEKSFYYLNRERYKLGDLPASLEFKCLDFCFVNVCKFANLFDSASVMSRKNRDFIIDWARHKSGKPKVLVEHYPLIEEHPFIRCRHKLWGEKEVLNILRKGDIDLSLCGHVHWPTARIDERGRGEIIIGSATANKCFALIEYDEKIDVFKYNKISVE